MLINSIGTAYYRALLNQKVINTKNLLAQFKIPKPFFAISSPQYYRMRAEFYIWHKDEKIHYTIFNKNKSNPVFINTFPIAAKKINELMEPLLFEIQKNETLYKKLFRVDFLTTTGERETIVTLIYHKKLDHHWENQITYIQNKLNISIIGRAKKQKIIIGKDHVLEIIKINGKTFHYEQLEGSFTQPNGRINIKMLSWADKITRGSKGDLLELYCGNGNFTCVLAKNFRCILATEIARAVTYTAINNLKKNNITNVQLVRISSEDLTEAIQKKRNFYRLRNINLDDYKFNTIFVDPPRGGLDDKTMSMISNYPTIIYISCNQHTLTENLFFLTKTHKIIKFAVFDQFPYTDHLETGIVLEKI